MKMRQTFEGIGGLFIGNFHYWSVGKKPQVCPVSRKYIFDTSGWCVVYLGSSIKIIRIKQQRYTLWGYSVDCYQWCCFQLFEMEIFVKALILKFLKCFEKN